MVAAALTALTAWARKSSQWDADASRRKADYVFMEAVNSHLAGDESTYYEMLRHAHELNPDDEETANIFAIYLIHLEYEDSATVRRGLDMMKRYFKSHPADLYSGLNYALLANSAGYSDEALSTYGTIHRLNPDRSGITFHYAEMLVNTGRPSAIDSAMAIYDSLEVSEGLDIDLARARMRIPAMKGDTAAVVSEARRLLASAPLNVDINRFLGSVYASYEQNDSALAYFTRACDIDSTNAAAVYTRAGFYHQIGDSAAFDREIFRVLKMDNLDMDVKMEVMRDYVGELYGDSLQEPRIIDLFNQLVNIHPHHADLRRFYAAYLGMIDHQAEAAEQQSVAMDLNPDDLDGWMSLVGFEMGAGDNHEAEEAVKRGLHYFPNAPKLYMLGSVVTTDEDNLAPAFDYLHKAIAVTDTNDHQQLSVISCMMGDLYFLKADMDSAITCYEQSIEYDPFNEVALNNCAYNMANENRDLDKALSYIERVAGLDATDASWVDTYAWVLFKLKRYADAKEQIDRALEMQTDPGVDELDHAGDIYFFNGEHEAAIEFWEKALKLKPGDERIRRKVKNKAYFIE